MPLWLAADPLVLASRSAIRKKILMAAGIPVEVRPADIDERGLEETHSAAAPGEIAARLAEAKAAAVERKTPGRLVLGADQILVLDGKRFAKPADRAAARAQLRALSGRSHELHSAIAFVQRQTVLFKHADVARLTMRTMSDRFLDLYLDATAAGGAATASVGAYQIEGLGSQLFERIEGDYFTILGLPLLPALNFLRRQGCLAS